MVRILKYAIYLLKFDNGLEVEYAERENGELDYIKPLNGPVWITFYLNYK